jgi:hypothetical protein
MYKYWLDNDIPLWMGEIGFDPSYIHWQEQMEYEMSLLTEYEISYTLFVFGVNAWSLAYDIVDASYNLTTVGNLYKRILNSTRRGTPIAWIQGYYPGTNNEAADTADTDHDGLMTWQEYIAGTDPTNSNSVFRVFEQGSLDTSNYIKWFGSTNSGVTSDFGICRSTNLVSGWGQLYTTVPRGSTLTNLWWDTNAPSAGIPMFYRPVATNAFP